ncbi:hypothetical protein Ade02nite_57930 [Paractinoplanes deccanensis]|uniref:Uncharacterized protein n=1 Tax=Paractinoplanes deccanensis TaxID=113561 RepID=A0ABQ3YAW7_9ACTN|nr:hypothetical protein [Actinoplanes deccanensis]GID77152.1 hypothetical protein Ade02nite_57930 [Actinoplanes deccanensis]
MRRKLVTAAPPITVVLGTPAHGVALRDGRDQPHLTDGTLPAAQVTNTLANSRNKVLPSGLAGPVTLRPSAVRTAKLEATR